MVRHRVLHEKYDFLVCHGDTGGSEEINRELSMGCQTCFLLVTRLDALPISYRRHVGAKVTTLGSCRVFIKHRRSENSPFSRLNSPADVW